MGLKDVGALRSFCLELSSDEPSPGGGTAAAASGAMAASLLVMVCGITARSKKHAADKRELESLGRSLAKARDKLIDLAKEDAHAYDLVVMAMRKARADGDRRSKKSAVSALGYAAEVPMNTASLCIDVLEGAVRVSEIGSRSASSDVGVATHLAYVGYMGAAMNVRINLKDLGDSAFVKSADRKLAVFDDRAEKLKRGSLRALQKATR